MAAPMDNGEWEDHAEDCVPHTFAFIKTSALLPLHFPHCYHYVATLLPFSGRHYYAGYQSNEQKFTVWFHCIMKLNGFINNNKANELPFNMCSCKKILSILLLNTRH